MEKVFNSAVEAISLAPADKGLPVASLWGAVSDASAAMGCPTLTTTLRGALWRMLGEREGDLRAHVPGAGAAPGRDLTWASPEMATPRAAEDAGVHLLATPALQDAALGIYGARLSRFQISADQRRTLAVLGEAKGRGALQSRLTAELGIEARNYHYVIKNLEERGLIVKTPTVLQTRGGAGVTTTNLIMLSKFAPQAMRPRGARLHDGRNATMGGGGAPLGGPAGGAAAPGDDDDASSCGSGSEDEDGAGGGGAEGAGAPLHVVNDDDARLARITDFLATQPDHSMLEAELKRELGYVGTPGHRRWRRMRKILLRRGCVDRFRAHVGDNAGRVGFGVRLLRAYTREDEEEWAIKHLLDPATNRLDVFGTQVAEISIDRQILRMLAAAGPEGVTTSQLDTALRINMKRNEPRLRELRVKLGEGAVTEAHVNQGKMRMLKFTAGDAALAALDTALTGVAAGDAAAAPSGGFAAAVADAIAAGLNPDGTDPLQMLLQREGGAEEEDEGEGEAAGPSGAAPAVDAAPGPSPAPGPCVAPAAAPAAGLEPAGEAAPPRRARKSAPATELAQLRRQWLVDFVAREGVMLQAEAASFLQFQERTARGNPAAVRPDKKVLQRVVDAAVEAGELVVVQTSLPGSHAAQTRQVTALARPGMCAGADFVSLVMQRHKGMRDSIREKNIAALDDLRREPEGETLPVLPKPSRGRPPGSGAAAGEAAPPDGRSDKAKSHAAMVENGLLPSRILRIRRAHEAVWEAVRSRGGAPCPDLHPGVAAAAAEGKVFTVTHVPPGAPGALGSATRPLAMAPFRGGAKEAALVVSTDELWAGMAVETYLRCLGTRTPDKAAVGRLRRGDAPLGALPKRDLRALAGGKDAVVSSKSRLVHLLDNLHDMGLIASLVPLGDSAAAGTAGGGGAGAPKASITAGGSAAWVLRPTAQYEELVGEVGGGEEGGEEGGGAGGGPAPRPATVTHSFDVSTPTGRAAYWHSMQFMVMCTSQGATAGAVALALRRHCFPFFLVGELASERSWVGKAITSEDQVAAVMRSLHGYELPRDAAAAAAAMGEGEAGMEVEPSGEGGPPAPGEMLTWQAAVALADHLAVPFEAVARGIMREQTQRKSRAEKGAGRAGPRRLGGLGARRALGAPRGPRSRRKRRRGGDNDSSGADDFGDEYLGGLGDLDFGGGADADDGVAPAPRPVIQRKKRWYADEDRAMLRAWARWLADKGPDAILRWKYIKGRPPGVLPQSLKRRLQRLRDEEPTGASMLKILELAAGVHSRRVRAAAGAGAAGGEAAVGDKRPAEGAEQGGGSPIKRARGGEGQPVEAPGAAELRPKLWRLAGEADAEALRAVLAEIEAVVAEAPARHTAPRPPENVRALAAAAAAAASGRAAGLAGPGALAGAGPRGPLPSTRQLTALRMWARAAAEARAGGTVAAPPPPVAAAMELTRALLLAVREGAPADAAFSSSLTARFAAEEIKAAVAELVRLGHVTVGAGAGGRAAAAAALHGQAVAAGGGLALSSRFLAETQPVFLPAAAFEGERQAEAALLAEAPQQAAAARTLFPEDPIAAVAPGEAGEEAHFGADLSGGGVAAALARGLALALGPGPSVELGAILPRSVKVPGPPAAAAAGDAPATQEDGEEAEDVLLRILSSIRVTATLRRAAGDDEGGEGAGAAAPAAGFTPVGPRFSLAAAGALGRAAEEVQYSASAAQEVQYSSAEEVLFQPALVASIRAVRARAETAAKKLFASKRIGEGATTVAALLGALEAAGAEGLTAGAAAAALVAAAGSPGQVGEALAALARCGLVRRVTGYDDVRAVASAAMKDRLAFPPPGAAAAAALAPLGLPAQGKPQPCADVPIRPWVDHAGRFRRGLWAAVARRAVATAAAAPGAPGDVLLQAMRVVNPQHGREALAALCAAGVLRARREAAPAPPVSVLAACFGGGGPAAAAEGPVDAVYGSGAAFPAGGPEEDARWLFFAAPAAMWRAGEVLPPAVLVPLGGEGPQQ